MTLTSITNNIQQKAFYQRVKPENLHTTMGRRNDFFGKNRSKSQFSTVLEVRDSEIEAFDTVHKPIDLVRQKDQFSPVAHRKRTSNRVNTKKTRKAGMMKIQKKTVRFSDDNIIHSIQKITKPAQIMNIWFSKDELQAMKTRTALLGQALDEGIYFEEDEAQTTRGLEYHTITAKNTRHYLRDLAFCAVMDEQAQQRMQYCSIYDPEKISDAYRRHGAVQCQNVANITGLQAFLDNCVTDITKNISEIYCSDEDDENKRNHDNISVSTSKSNSSTATPSKLFNVIRKGVKGISLSSR